MCVRAQDQRELVWKTWEDSSDSLVFHVPSRQTHLLDELTAAVLRIIRNGTHTVESVAEQLIREFELESEAQADAVRFVTVAIPRLAELGLIRGFVL